MHVDSRYRVQMYKMQTWLVGGQNVSGSRVGCATKVEIDRGLDSLRDEDGGALIQ